MTVRYVLHSGTVKSQNDGQIHRVSAGELITLYHLNPRECIFHPVWPYSLSFKLPENALHLYPQSNGDYSLPI
jgi:hypothetical protein